MRLREVTRGDRFVTRALFAVVSVATGSRFPDAGRAAMYHRRYVGPILNEWTHKVMRGPSAWTVGERELMAALVASWNSCPFCVGAHRAVAISGLPADVVDAALADHRTAPLDASLRGALTFLETMTRTPEQLTKTDAAAALDMGTTPQQLRDATEVAAVFNIVTRYANALDFDVPSPAEFDKAAPFLLKRGYK